MPPLSRQLAEAAYLGAAVRKEFEEGWFTGKVIKVLTNTVDKKDKKIVWPLLFKILYVQGSEHPPTCVQPHLARR